MDEVPVDSWHSAARIYRRGGRDLGLSAREGAVNRATAKPSAQVA